VQLVSFDGKLGCALQVMVSGSDLSIKRIGQCDRAKGEKGGGKQGRSSVSLIDFGVCCLQLFMERNKRGKGEDYIQLDLCLYILLMQQHLYPVTETMYFVANSGIVQRHPDTACQCQIVISSHLNTIKSREEHVQLRLSSVG
jgi:hypothetical protein